MDTALTALIAEDDRALADILRLALTRGGYAVTVAHDGRKALQLGTTTKFDVVVSDHQMPGLNGEQVLQGIRAEGASQEARLFLCSAKSFELDTDKISETLGLSGVFYKPFSLGELVAKIKSVHNTAVI